MSDTSAQEVGVRQVLRYHEHQLSRPVAYDHADPRLGAVCGDEEDTLLWVAGVELEPASSDVVLISFPFLPNGHLVMPPELRDLVRRARSFVVSEQDGSL